VLFKGDALSRVLTLLALCGMGLVLIACGGDGDGGVVDAATDTLTFAADDGSASLVIPATALPPDVLADDIHVVRVTEDDIAEGEGDLEGAAVYLLEPDGLQLGEGAVLTTEVLIPDGYMPIALQIGSGEMPVEGTDEPLSFVFDVVEGTTVIYDTELKAATLSVPVRHFSSLIVLSNIEYAFFQITGTPGSAVIGQKPNAQVTIKQKASNLTSGDYPGEKAFYVGYGEYEGWPDWFYLPVEVHEHFKRNEGLKGTLSLRFALAPNSAILVGRLDGSDEILDPNRNIADRPPRTPLGEQFTVPNTDFTCSNVGPGHIDFILDLAWTENWELQRAWDPTWRRIGDRFKSHIFIVRTPVTCTAAGTTTTSSTETTTSEPPTGEEVGDQENAESEKVAAGEGVPAGDITNVVYVPGDSGEHCFIVDVVGDGETVATAAADWYDVIFSVNGPDGEEWRANVAYFGPTPTDRGVYVGPPEPGQQKLEGATVTIAWDDGDTFRGCVDGGETILGVESFTVSVGVSTADGTFWDYANGVA